MIKQYYYCDICGDQKNESEVVGCNIIGFSEFKLGAATIINIPHFCIDCLEQLVDQAAEVIASKKVT